MYLTNIFIPFAYANGVTLRSAVFGESLGRGRDANINEY